MNDSWDDVERLFGDAVALDPAARAVLLDARCVGRLERRREAESLLAAHDAAGAFLDVHPSAATAARETALDLTGATIGRYRLVERIGEGGMGVVYRGERADHEFVEEVAVKLLPLPMHGAEPLRRFRVERQALASLNHPDIVSLVDGGLTGGGQAFLAMRFVAGVPITEFCARHALGLDQRLGLFQRVCSAIQHAHRNGVVHCDLKPANILVTADGAPKILDFGVAKLLDARAARIDATATTAWRPLTPNYASPEQMRGLPVTTSCDVYALGIVLYELVAGTRPYDVTGLPLDAMLTTIVSRDARRPSAAASTGLPYPARHVKADLDAIVLKAISKEPARRYGSAQELADDIGRQLASQPVAAREPSLAYVVGTLARRHRASFIASSISIAALVTALGVSLWQTRTATIERNRATTRFNDLRQLANALIFKIHDGVQPLPGSTPVRQTVVAEALRYLERLTADPSADDSLRLDIAKGYLRLGTIQGLPDVPNLGDRESAFRSLQNAITLLEPLTAGTAAAEAALTMDDALVAFSRVAGALGKRDDALTAIRRAAQHRQRRTNTAVLGAVADPGKTVTFRARPAVAPVVWPTVVGLQSGASMAEHSSRPFYGEYAWAFDLLIDRPVGADCAAIADWLSERGVLPGATLLDAGCGTGRYAAELARRGYGVEGVDRSSELIETARQSVCGHGQSVSFRVADILALPAARYDGILCRGVLNDFVDDDARRSVFASFAGALRPAGVLIVDVREWEATRDRKRREPVFRKSVLTDRGTLTFTSTTELDPGRQQLLLSETHTLVNDAGEQSSDYRFVMRCWTRSDLESIVVRSGFGSAVYFGAYDPAVHAGATDRLVAVAQLSEVSDASGQFP